MRCSRGQGVTGTSYGLAKGLIGVSHNIRIKFLYTLFLSLLLSCRPFLFQPIACMTTRLLFPICLAFLGLRAAHAQTAFPYLLSAEEANAAAE